MLVKLFGEVDVVEQDVEFTPPLPLGVWRLRRSVIIVVAVFVVVVYPDDGASKGSGFPEGNEDGLVDLSGGVALDAHEEQRYAAEHDYCRDDQLDNIYLFVVHDFSFDGAKVQVFSEVTK